MLPIHTRTGWLPLRTRQLLILCCPACPGRRRVSPGSPPPKPVACCCYSATRRVNVTVATVAGVLEAIYKCKAAGHCVTHTLASRMWRARTRRCALRRKGGKRCMTAVRAVDRVGCTVRRRLGKRLPFKGSFHARRMEGRGGGGGATPAAVGESVRAPDSDRVVGVLPAAACRLLPVFEAGAV